MYEIGTVPRPAQWWCVQGYVMYTVYCWTLVASNLVVGDDQAVASLHFRRGFSGEVGAALTTSGIKPVLSSSSVHWMEAGCPILSRPRGNRCRPVTVFTLCLVPVPSCVVRSWVLLGEWPFWYRPESRERQFGSPGVGQASFRLTPPSFP